MQKLESNIYFWNWHAYCVISSVNAILSCISISKYFSRDLGTQSVPQSSSIKIAIFQFDFGDQSVTNWIFLGLLKVFFCIEFDQTLDILQSKTASLDGLRKYDTGTSISTSIHTSLGFQRAVFLSYGGCAIAVVMAVPATLFGAVAKATDWSQTEWGHQPDDKEATLVLPLCLQVNVDSQFCNWSRIA